MLKYKNNKCLPQISAVSVFSLAVNHSPSCLPRMHSNTGLVFRPVVGAVQALI